MLSVYLLTGALFLHRRRFTGAAVVAENIGRQLILTGTRLSLYSIFIT